MTENLPPIDPLADDFVLVGDLVKRLPHRPSPPTVCRWILRGVNGTRLRTLKIAGRHATTEREFRRFLAALDSAAAIKSDADRDAVDRQLSAAGYR